MYVRRSRDRARSFRFAFGMKLPRTAHNCASRQSLSRSYIYKKQQVYEYLMKHSRRRSRITIDFIRLFYSTRHTHTHKKQNARITISRRRRLACTRGAIRIQLTSPNINSWYDIRAEKFITKNVPARTREVSREVNKDKRRVTEMIHIAFISYIFHRFPT